MSWEATKGKFGTLFVLGLVVMLISLGGYLVFFVGSLVTGPIVLIAIAKTYRILANRDA